MRQYDLLRSSRSGNALREPGRDPDHCNIYDARRRAVTRRDADSTTFLFFSSRFFFSLSQKKKSEIVADQGIAQKSPARRKSPTKRAKRKSPTVCVRGPKNRTGIIVQRLNDQVTVRYRPSVGTRTYKKGSPRSRIACSLDLRKGSKGKNAGVDLCVCVCVCVFF